MEELFSITFPFIYRNNYCRFNKNGYANET
jgi:hypothetical protein